MAAVRILLCGLALSIVVWFWPDGLIYLGIIIGGVLALAMLLGAIALINEQPTLAVALLLLLREDGDKDDR